MPVGYFVSILIPTIATVLALRPRPTRGPRATPAFTLATTANEIPLLIAYWLLAVTALAVAQGNITSPLGWATLGITACTLIGLSYVIRQAVRTGTRLDETLAGTVGPHLSNDVRPHRRRRLSGGQIARVLVSPVRIHRRAVRRVRNIPYGPFGRQNLLDVYLRRSRPSGCPVLIYFHPGGFFSGGKSREARALFDTLVATGWVCISANYRLGRAGEFPNNLTDAKRTIAWIRGHGADYGADPNTIVVAGGSAGAYLGAMCGLTAGQSAFQPGFEEADTSVSAVVGLYGFYGQAPSSSQLRSDLESYLRADAPPFLIIHGSRDQMISVDRAQQFAGRLGATSGAPVLYAELPGGQHNFDRFPSIRYFAVIDAIQEFGRWIRSSAP